jgi:hypothetical protein
LQYTVSDILIVSFNNTWIIKTGMFKGVVEVSVEDTGCGISPEATRRIFEPFEQENNSESRNYQGVGLGLAIAQEIVRRHGGEIVVQSAVGRGSSFTVRLPVEPPLDVDLGYWVKCRHPITATQPATNNTAPMTHPATNNQSITTGRHN